MIGISTGQYKIFSRSWEREKKNSQLYHKKTRGTVRSKYCTCALPPKYKCYKYIGHVCVCIIYCGLSYFTIDPSSGQQPAAAQQQALNIIQNVCKHRAPFPTRMLLLLPPDVVSHDRHLFILYKGEIGCDLREHIRCFEY